MMISINELMKPSLKIFQTDYLRLLDLDKKLLLNGKSFFHNPRGLQDLTSNLLRSIRNLLNVIPHQILESQNRRVRRRIVNTSRGDAATASGEPYRQCLEPRHSEFKALHQFLLHIQNSNRNAHSQIRSLRRNVVEKWLFHFNDSESSRSLRILLLFFLLPWFSFWRFQWWRACNHARGRWFGFRSLKLHVSILQFFKHDYSDSLEWLLATCDCLIHNLHNIFNFQTKKFITMLKSIGQSLESVIIKTNIWLNYKKYP